MTATLSVIDLQTHFFTGDGVVRAVDGVSFSVQRGEVLGLVGESGSGKSVTGFSILGLVDPPGRITGGSILFKGEELIGRDDEQLRTLRGKDIAMIFQDPMMTLNPSAGPRRWNGVVRRWCGSELLRRMNACVPIRTSFPVVCASALQSPLHC